MLKNIIYIIVFILIIFIGIGFVLPRYVHVERSIAIDRPAATVFTLVNGYRTFNQWSPWVARDPTAEYTLSGPDFGVGARMEWTGDPRLSGSGHQEIIESEPYSRVRSRLAFDQQGEAEAEFDIAPQPDGDVAVTWTFDTDLIAGQTLFGSLLARYFGLLFDRWIGGDYEEGLTKLKAFAESLPDVDFSDLEVQHLDVQPMPILYIESASGQAPDDIANALAAAYGEITRFMNENSIPITGQPMAINRAWDEEGYAFDAAIPGDPGEVTPTGNVRSGMSPAGSAVRVVHRGPYDRMLTTYEKLRAYMAARGMEEGAASWEHYISDPGTTAEEDLITHIYFLVGEADG